MTASRVGVALLYLAAAALGQERPLSNPTGGSLRGSVVDAKSGDPLAKATVIVRRGQEPGLGTVTGRDGSFALRDLQPGVYTITAERQGYVIPKGKPQTVTVEAAQDTSDMKLTMVRTGTISGRVMDPDGDPLSGVYVTIIPIARNRPPANLYATTNDRGEYRAFYIPPGEYRISVVYTPRNDYGDVRMQPAKAGDPTTFAGAYPRVYYPASLDPRQATTVNVEPGAELSGFDLQLVRAHGVKIRGRVLPITGNSPAPLFQIVSLRPLTNDAPELSHTFLIRDSKGEFELDDVLPGKYRLHVEGGGPSDSSDAVAAHMDLEVGATDIDGIQLSAVRRQRVSGSITPPQGRKLPAGLFATIAPRDSEERQGGAMAQINPDGSFTFQQVEAGDYDFGLGSTNTGDDTYVSSMRIGDTDAMNGIRIGEAPAGPLAVLLKANGATLECTVTDENGESIPGAKVALIPDPPRERQTMLIGDCVTQPDGMCKIQGIAPGEYHVYALPTDSETNYRDPDALKPFEKYRQALQFEEGERKTAQLKLPPA